MSRIGDAWLSEALLSLERVYWQAWRENETCRSSKSRRHLLEAQQDIEALQDWATRAAHERVDAAYRSCDIAGPHGLGLFLSDHLRAFSALSLTEGAGYAQAQALRAEYRHALEADLAALGLPLPEDREQLRVTAVPALYIFLGSRRGAQMMHRHWSASARGEARSAGSSTREVPRQRMERD